MVHPADKFVFQPPPLMAFARRVLIKPHVSQPIPYPVSTSRETLEAIIAGVRRVSDADIILLERGRGRAPIQEVFRAVGYDFPRVLALDVRDCVYVEVENPLPKPLALPTFWVPNILLSCDYLISVAPFKVRDSQVSFSISNLLGLLPPSKYAEEGKPLEELGLDNVIADLYFTFPFDLGVIDARTGFFQRPGGKGQARDFGKIFSGEPFAVDQEAAEFGGLEVGYLQLIASAKATFAA